MGKGTPLYTQHQRAGAKLVDFAGWDMPLHYGSQLEEHHHVRRTAGIFDVSHMAVVDINGNNAPAYLRYVLANNVDRLTTPGKALYSCMLNEHGGVIDDLIVYFISSNHYRLVVNAGTRIKDLAWLIKQAEPFAVTVKERTDLAMLAAQGPLARSKIEQILNPAQYEQARNLAIFGFAQMGEWLIARTGYTGEDGFEFILPNEEAPSLWQACLNTGIHPCGLGARDTLRLEAGLNLYGSDMDETITPLEANLAWTVAFKPEERAFIGRTALEQQLQQGLPRQLVGLVLEERGILRAHQQVVIEGVGTGEITSGSFSPTLGYAIALARIPAGSENKSCQVIIRDKTIPVKIVKPPFVRHGKKVFI